MKKSPVNRLIITGSLLAATCLSSCGSHKTAVQQQWDAKSRQEVLTADSLHRQETAQTAEASEWSRRHTDDQRTTLTAERFDPEGRVTERVTAVTERARQAQEQQNSSRNESDDKNLYNVTGQQIKTSEQQTDAKNQISEKKESTAFLQIGWVMAALALLLAVVAVARWKKRPQSPKLSGTR